MNRSCIRILLDGSVVILFTMLLSQPLSAEPKTSAEATSGTSYELGIKPLCCPSLVPAGIFTSSDLSFRKNGNAWLAWEGMLSYFHGEYETSITDSKRHDLNGEVYDHRGQGIQGLTFAALAHASWNSTNGDEQPTRIIDLGAGPAYRQAESTYGYRNEDDDERLQVTRKQSTYGVAASLSSSICGIENWPWGGLVCFGVDWVSAYVPLRRISSSVEFRGDGEDRWSPRSNSEMEISPRFLNPYVGLRF